jgi:hypothetical protein
LFKVNRSFIVLSDPVSYRIASDLRLGAVFSLWESGFCHKPVCVGIYDTIILGQIPPPQYATWFYPVSNHYTDSPFSSFTAPEMCYRSG